MLPSTFRTKAHINYFERCLTALPPQAQEHDSNRITLAYFCLSGLALLDALEREWVRSKRDEWIEWVWSLQNPEGGFRGSTFMTPSAVTAHDANAGNPAHLPSTYTALLVLGLLRANLARLNVDGLHSFLRECQEADGSFSPLPVPLSEKGRPSSFQSDARMAYCASAISSMLDGEALPAGSKRFDREKTISWLEACQTWEGGYGARPGLEAQGGTTYCCIASFNLLSHQHSEHTTSRTIRYLSHRQVADGRGGFQGRPGKVEDVCYSFWCGAGLRLLSGAEEVMFDQDANERALLEAQSPVGGFGKAPGEYPDPFHSYLGIAALAMLAHEGTECRIGTAGLIGPEARIGRLDPAWNIDMDTKAWLIEAMTRRRFEKNGRDRDTV